jgi:hypothetical protein
MMTIFVKNSFLKAIAKNQEFFDRLEGEKIRHKMTEVEDRILKLDLENKRKQK